MNTFRWIIVLCEWLRRPHPEWRPDEPVGVPPQMRRYHDGRWEYRLMTPEEQGKFADDIAW